MTDPPSLVIAGGGIGGLTAALACASSGIASHVVERGREPTQLGAGIQISPNAGRILDDLGLADALKEIAAEPTGIAARNQHGSHLATLPLGPMFRERYGSPYRTAHRADLVKALSDAISRSPLVETAMASSVVSFAASAGDVAVTAESTEGLEQLIARGLVGADGLHSQVRSSLSGSPKSRTTGRVAWRTMIEAASMPRNLPRDEVGLWLGREGHVVHYPVRRGREFNIVVVTEAPTGGASPDFDSVRKRLSGWAEPLPSLLAVETDWQSWPISVVPPPHKWSEGPVALLGDAAHAMVPFLAQGGAMAIEDAAALANAVKSSSGNISAAFADYRATRQRRVQRVWRAAAQTGAIYQLGVAPALLRDTAMRVVGGPRLMARYDWIYRWKPPQTKTRRPEAARSNGDGSVAS